MSDHLVYLAVGPCGCGFAIDCDDDERARENVRRWHAQGATVERVPIEEAKERLVFDCPHEPKYGLDWVARVEGLQAEVTRLRKALEVPDPTNRSANPEAWDREAYRRQLHRALRAEADAALFQAALGEIEGSPRAGIGCEQQVIARKALNAVERRYVSQPETISEEAT